MSSEATPLYTGLAMMSSLLTADAIISKQLCFRTSIVARCHEASLYTLLAAIILVAAEGCSYLLALLNEPDDLYVGSKAPSAAGHSSGHRPSTLCATGIKGVCANVGCQSRSCCQGGSTGACSCRTDTKGIPAASTCLIRTGLWFMQGRRFRNVF